jgi:hypothetical protein
MRKLTAEPWNGSDDLMLVIISLNNSVKKRVEQASKAAADYLDHTIFIASGPMKSLARYRRATGEHAGECLLQNFIPEGYLQSFACLNPFCPLFFGMGLMARHILPKLCPMFGDLYCKAEKTFKRP